MRDCCWRSCSCRALFSSFSWRSSSLVVVESSARKDPPARAKMVTAQAHSTALLLSSCAMYHLRSNPYAPPPHSNVKKERTPKLVWFLEKLEPLSLNPALGGCLATALAFLNPFKGFTHTSHFSSGEFLDSRPHLSLSRDGDCLKIRHSICM